MLFIQSFRPDARLREFVENYLFISAAFSDPYIDYKVLPHVFLCMSFQLGAGEDVLDLSNGTFLSPHVIVGPCSKVCRLRVYRGMKRVLVNLKFSGWHRLFGTPVSQFVNRSTCLQEWQAPGSSPLAVPPASVTDNKSVRECIDEFLLRRLETTRKPAGKDIDAALRLIMESKGRSPIQLVANHSYMTRRTMERHFLQQTGLHPKMFSRIIRFNETVRYIRKRSRVSWPRLVQALGYYDQSHFVNEFHFFAGCSPQQYFSRLAEYEMLSHA